MNPKKLFKTRGGQLSIDGITIKTIVGKTGSPLYLYDASIMRRQYKRLASAVPKGTAIHYSIKANPNQAIVKIFRQMGAGAEVASKSELELALKCGFNSKKIIFAGPGKSVDEIKLAVKNQIGSINVESRTELERILEAAGGRRKAKTGIALRVNLDLFNGNEGEVMTGGSRKFGIDTSVIDAGVLDASDIKPLIRKALDDERVELLGFHCYLGTGLLNTRSIAAAYRKFAVWAQGMAQEMKFHVKILNFGGGFGIPFSENEKELDVKKLGSALKQIKNNLNKHHFFRQTRFILEPGRYLVGPSGVYVSRVTDLKKSQNDVYIVTEGGIHHALIPIVLNKNYPTAILNKMGRRPTIVCNVAGPLCASADQFSRKVKLPAPEIGDLIGIFNSGAYGYTAGMVYFLSHPTPAEVLVDNGKLYLIRNQKNPDHGISKGIRLRGK